MNQQDRLTRHTPSAARAARRSRDMITPEGLALPISRASRGSRLGALIIDLMILFGIWLLVNIVLERALGDQIATASGDPLNPESEATSFIQIAGVLFGFCLWYGYFLSQELAPRGATFGKRIMGIRVAARDGRRLTAEAIIARNLMRDIEVFYPIVYFVVAVVFSIFAVLGMEPPVSFWAALIWFFLFALFPCFNRDALRAGDIIAGTWVVDAPKTKLDLALSTQGAAAQGTSEITGMRYDFGDEELSIYGEHELQTLERILRNAQPDALATVHSTICQKIGWDPGAGDERAFLEAFYAQLRAKLEGDMRFGVRKADKFS